MKSLNSYGKGFNRTFNNKKMITAIYAVLLLLALTLAVPFGKTLRVESGNSLAISKLLTDFDYTVYTDFMREAGSAIRPYLAIAFWVGVFYFIFTVFFSGGILTLIKENGGTKSLKIFWVGCSEYFWRFLRLALYMLVIQLIAAAIIYIPLYAIISSVGKTSAEPTVFYIALGGVIIHIMVIVILLAISDYAKIMMIRNQEYRPLRTMIRSFGFVFRHLFSTMGLYKLLLIFPIILFILYFAVIDRIGMTGGLAILITFILQQIFIWLRIYVKVWFLASELDLYDEFNYRKVTGTEDEPVLQN